ncbi:MAG: adenylate/guanylate cyclase domain-containing protein [Candidatus Dormiibacterota bacterium]
MATGAKADIITSAEQRSGNDFMQEALGLYAGGDPTSAARLMEKAYRAYVDAGDQLGAVRVTTRLVLANESIGNYSAARGWDQRGWRLLDQLGPSIERGYHHLAWVACDVHDPQDLLRRTEQALSIAREFKDPQLELRAQAEKGLALASLGRVDDGFSLMDEVMVGIAAGELPDATTRGLTFCALLSACDRTGDRGRAEYWGKAVEEDPQVEQMGMAVTHCEIVQGSVDAMRGQWEGADARLSRAVVAEKSAMMHQASSAGKLAELRIQQGRYDEAAELLRDFQDEFEAAPAVASLSIAQGDYQKAAGVLRSYTRGLGSDCLRLAPALSQLVDLELRRDDQPAAARASRRLQQLAEGDCGSNEVRALAHMATARLAGVRGEHDEAIDGLEAALALIVNRERPLMMAQIRLELARALHEAGEPGSAAVEAEAALMTFEKLGVVQHATAAQELLALLAAEGPPLETVRASLPAEGRLLATVLFTDIVGSTEQAARMGDRDWKSMLDEHDRTVEQVVARFHGRVVNHTGDGILATFDGPNSALRCAEAMKVALAKHGLRIRTGVHTGEVELRGANVGGIAVHTAARVMSHADADEIMVSSTVRDLVAGSGIEFSDRGQHQLKGVPGEWQLLAVESLPD